MICPKLEFVFCCDLDYIISCFETFGSEGESLEKMFQAVVKVIWLCLSLSLLILIYPASTVWWLRSGELQCYDHSKNPHNPCAHISVFHIDIEFYNWNLTFCSSHREFYS